MKQPKALLPLFFNEMWERFGYYSIQGLLVLFLIHQLHFSDANAFITLGVFLSLVYLSPLFGGLLADRFLGYRYSILWGGILLCLGYLLLSYGRDVFLHLSLGTIIVGNGLLKPNNAAFLGQFYYHDDPRRYPGFTFYYIGINIGGLLSIILSGLASEYIGYHTAFALAGFGMLVALIVFVYGFRFFENRGQPQDPLQIKNKFIRASANYFNLVILLVIGILLFHFLLHRPRITEILTIMVAIGVMISLFYLQTTYNQTTRNKLIAVIILIAASIIFWALHLQIFFSLMLFTERNVDRMFFHYTVPTPLFLILEPILILIIGPLLAHLWEKLSYRGREPSPSYKFAFALISIGIAMGVLVLGVIVTPNQKLVSAFWLFLFYLFLTIGELFISPTGLAMITELAPTKLTGFMLGVWYMVLGMGGLLAGILARLVLTSPNIKLQLLPLNSFSYAFSTYAVLALLTGFFLLLIAPQLNKLMYTHIE